MRRVVPALFVALLSLPLLAGCGGNAQKNTATARGVTVSGAYGAAPSVTFPKGTPDAGDKVSSAVAVQGKGPAYKPGALMIGNLALYIWNGTDNPRKASTFADGTPVDLNGLTEKLPELGKVLNGQKVGGRVLGIVPIKAAFPQQTPQSLKPTDALVYVADVVGEFSGGPATTAAQAGKAAGDLPEVTGAAGQAPTVAIPDREPPKTLVVNTVTEGTGPAVKKGQLVVFQYLGYTWAERKRFDASWDRGRPFSTQIGVGAVVKGWDEGLAGKKVGSRVLLVLPPEYGYGAKGQGEIKGNSTLVFVVDILGAYGKST